VNASWLVLLAIGATEQWADEPSPPQDPPKVSSPRLGAVAGLHLGVSAWTTLAPDIGARAGVRLRLGEHAALSSFVDFQLITLPPAPRQPFPNPIRGQTMGPELLLAQSWLGVARIELISSSASSVILVPKLTAGLYFGAGAALAPGYPAAPLFSGGLHLALTRLEPSGWWIPVFFDVGLDATPTSLPMWRFVFGVGI
jgi:hypothetical protein